MSPSVFCLSSRILTCTSSPSLNSYSPVVDSIVKPAGAETATSKLWLALWLPVIGATTYMTDLFVTGSLYVTVGRVSVVPTL